MKQFFLVINNKSGHGFNIGQIVVKTAEFGNEFLAQYKGFHLGTIDHFCMHDEELISLPTTVFNNYIEIPYLKNNAPV